MVDRPESPAKPWVGAQAIDEMVHFVEGKAKGRFEANFAPGFRDVHFLDRLRRAVVAKLSLFAASLEFIDSGGQAHNCCGPQPTGRPYVR